MGTIDRRRLGQLLADEDRRFGAAHQRSRELFERGRRSLLAGDRYMHLAALNRGILLTPFHNMALVAPDTSEADIDLHTRVFRESVEALVR